MHVNDFREDLEPTLAQWRAIAQGFCRLAGETAPASRAAALELILRLEAEPGPGAAAAPPAGVIDPGPGPFPGEPGYIGNVARVPVAPANGSARSRTGGRP